MNAHVTADEPFVAVGRWTMERFLFNGRLWEGPTPPPDVCLGERWHRTTDDSWWRYTGNPSRPWARAVSDVVEGKTAMTGDDELDAIAQEAMDAYERWNPQTLPVGPVVAFMAGYLAGVEGKTRDAE